MCDKECENCRCNKQTSDTHITIGSFLEKHQNLETKLKQHFNVRHASGHENEVLAPEILLDHNTRIRWMGPIVYLNQYTGHNPKRLIKEIQWGELPLTVYCQDINSQGHDDAFAAATLDNIWREGDIVYGTGLFSNTEQGQKALQLVVEGTLRGISIDVRDGNYEAQYDEEGNLEEFIWTTARIGATTIVGQPAFENARIELLSDDYSMVRLASGKPYIYDEKYFSRISYDRLTEFKVDPETGELSGHLLVWGRKHRGIHRDWIAQPSGNLTDLHVGSTFVRNENGEISKIRTAAITAGGQHAPMHDLSMGREEISKFVQGYEEDRFEDIRLQIAQVIAWEDQYGLAVHGQIQPWVDEKIVTQAFAGCASVDERGNTLFGIHFVNTCGFLPVTEEEQQAGYRKVASGQPESKEQYGKANLKALEEAKRKVEKTNFAVMLAKTKKSK